MENEYTENEYTENKYTARELYKMSHEDDVKYPLLQGKPVRIYTNQSSFTSNPDTCKIGIFEEVNTIENTDVNNESNIYIEYINKPSNAIVRIVSPNTFIVFEDLTGGKKHKTNKRKSKKTKKNKSKKNKRFFNLHFLKYKYK